MKYINSFVVFAFLMLVVCLQTSAQTADVAEEDVENMQTYDKPREIIVTPMFKTSDIKDLILNLEEDFIARFNELNTDDDYDIACYNFTPTNSHIRKRTCEPNFLIEARASNAAEAAFDIGRAVTDQDRYEIYVASPQALQKITYREYEVLQSKLEEIADSDESMKAIAVEIDRLNARLKK